MVWFSLRFGGTRSIFRKNGFHQRAAQRFHLGQLFRLQPGHDTGKVVPKSSLALSAGLVSLGRETHQRLAAVGRVGKAFHKAVLLHLPHRAGNGRKRLMKLLNKVGDINGTVLSMETNAAQQPFQHGKVALGAVGQSGLHAGLGCFAQPVDVAAKPTETQRGFLRHAIPPLKKCLTAVNC